MKYLYFLLILFLCACSKPAVKPVVTTYTDFYYADTFKGNSMPKSNALELRVGVQKNRVFTNRLEQIEWALEVTEYHLNTDLSVLDFQNMQPSPYLSFNKLISVKHYLRLAGFHGQKIVVDDANKSIIYLNNEHPFFNDLTYFKPDDLVYQNTDVNSYEPVEVQSVDITEPLLPNAPTYQDDETDKNLLITDQSIVDDTNIENDTLNDSTQLIDDDDNLNDVESLHISPVIPDVIEEVYKDDFQISGNTSLRDLFTKLAEFYDYQFVSSLGRNGWFLDSTINHDYTFTSLDHALSLILKECNTILLNNNIDFLIKASLNNQILDLYYEK